ncbi:hypothetical protein N657DRAFT_708311, partial [Parathielavia appendiculata]
MTSASSISTSLRAGLLHGGVQARQLARRQTGGCQRHQLAFHCRLGTNICKPLDVKTWFWTLEFRNERTVSQKLVRGTTARDKGPGRKASRPEVA